MLGALPTWGTLTTPGRWGTTSGGLATLCPERFRPGQKGPPGWDLADSCRQRAPYTHTRVLRHECTNTPFHHQGVGKDTWELWDNSRRLGKETPGITEGESL